MNAIAQELKQLSGDNELHVDTDAQLGTLAIARYLEEVAPATSRQLYSVGHKLQEYEMRLSQESQTNEYLRRMLKANESGRPDLVFESMDAEVRSSVMRKGFSRDSDKFFAFKDSEEFTEVFLPKTFRLIRPIKNITVRAVEETENIEYLGDFDRLFRHMDAVASAQREIQYLEFIIPSYLKAVDALTNIDKLCGLDFSSFATTCLPVVHTKEDGNPRIDFFDWAGRTCSINLTPLEAIDIFLHTDLKKFMVDNFGHGNKDGLTFNCLKTVAAETIDDENLNLLRDMVDVYIFVNED